MKLGLFNHCHIECPLTLITYQARVKQTTLKYVGYMVTDVGGCAMSGYDVIVSTDKKMRVLTIKTQVECVLLIPNIMQMRL